MTLTEAAFWTKRVAIIGAIGIVIFAILGVILTSRANDPLPPEYLTANYACTETKEEFLDNKLEIPSLQVNNDSENIFEIQTDTGKVNNLSNLEIINVHKYRIKTQQLDSLIKAKEIASSLGFEPEEVHRVGTTDYIWVDNDNSRSLNINAKTLNFNMITKNIYEYYRENLRELVLPTENQAISTAKDEITRLGILGSDVNFRDENNISTHYIDINPDGSYSEAPSAAEAELIKVDFHKSKPMISIREDLENSNIMINTLNQNLGTPKEDDILINDKRITVYNYSAPVLYQNSMSSNISVYVGPDDPNSSDLKDIYQIDFTYWPLEAESCGTYELVSPTYALEKVQSGEGSLVYLNDRDGDEIEDYQPRSVSKYTIYEITIAYYEPATQPEFLQPIYVIKGETEFQNGERGEFYIYYPAINYDIVQDKIELPEAPIDENATSPFGL
jgi:hypothetical protein